MKSGKTGGMSGREMFMFNPSMVSTHVEGEEDEEGGEFDLGIRDNDDDPAVKVFTMLSSLDLILNRSKFDHSKENRAQKLARVFFIKSKSAKILNLEQYMYYVWPYIIISWT